MEIKKAESADLRKNILTYVLTGLAFMLLLSWQALEIESEEVVIIPPDMDLDMSQTQEEDVPIMMMQFDTPPPPPPPPVIPEKIEIVEDEKEIIEQIIAPTETTITEEIKEVKVSDVQTEARVEVIADVPFNVIENVPVYPGCEGKKNNEDRKKCMNEKIQSFVNKNFNTGLANEQGLEGRQQISVQFKVDKNGDVVDIITKAKNAALEKEALRVVGKLPKMTPGKQRNRPVGVIYGFPIIFKVQ